MTKSLVDEEVSRRTLTMRRKDLSCWSIGDPKPLDDNLPHRVQILPEGSHVIIVYLDIATGISAWFYPSPMAVNVWNVRSLSSNEPKNSPWDKTFDCYYIRWDPDSEIFTKGVSSLPNALLFTVPTAQRVLRELNEGTYDGDVELIQGDVCFEDR